MAAGGVFPSEQWIILILFSVFIWICVDKTAFREFFLILRPTYTANNSKRKGQNSAFVPYYVANATTRKSLRLATFRSFVPPPFIQILSVCSFLTYWIFWCSFFYLKLHKWLIILFPSPRNMPSSRASTNSSNITHKCINRIKINNAVLYYW